MPELITVNYFTDLIHFFIYLVIIYYVLYNVVWNKLRTFYYVNLSQTLNKKKITINYLYFIINYMYSLFSSKLNKHTLLFINLLTLQQKTVGYTKENNLNYTCYENELISSFYIENTYFGTTSQINISTEANASLYLIS